jgi:hypothetical protein
MAIPRPEGPSILGLLMNKHHATQGGANRAASSSLRRLWVKPSVELFEQVVFLKWNLNAVNH